MSMDDGWPRPRRPGEIVDLRPKTGAGFALCLRRAREEEDESKRERGTTRGSAILRTHAATNLRYPSHPELNMNMDGSKGPGAGSGCRKASRAKTWLRLNDDKGVGDASWMAGNPGGGK